MTIIKKLSIKAFTIIFAVISLSGCARDLSSSVYTSDSTLNIVLEGQILSARNVKIKENDKLGQNTQGATIGSLGGGAAGYSTRGGGAAVIGGAIVGGIIGAATEQALSTAQGMEYVVKVDTSKMEKDYYEGSPLMRNSLAAVKANGIITVVQAKESKNEPLITPGQSVLVIISEKRVRVIANLSK
jgi:outer membrane lipoprotein SlyB